jgi:hypothetical protein
MSDFKDNESYRSEVDYTALEAVPLVGRQQQQQQQQTAVIGCTATTIRCTDFPGNRRTVVLPPGPPPNMVLVKTGGNALQAVPQMVFEQKQPEHLVAVTVPENVSPGRTIYVQHGPRNENLLQATIPAGALPGHTFFVRVPDAFQVDSGSIVTATAEALSGSIDAGSAGDGAVVVAGRDAEGDLFLVQENSKDQVHNV